MASTPTTTGPGKRHSWMMIAVIGVVSVCAGVVLPQMLPADDAVTQASPPAEPSKKSELAYTPPAWPEAPDPKAMIMRLVLGTAIVLGLCVCTLLLSKRWLRGMPVKSSTAGPLSLVDTLALGNRCQVHLIGVGKRRILIGVDASGLKSVVPLTEPFEETLGDLQEPNDLTRSGPLAA
jgi:flagellar biogenesis protein FliO